MVEAGHVTTVLTSDWSRTSHKNGRSYYRYTSTSHYTQPSSYYLHYTQPKVVRYKPVLEVFN